jgi:hypothetical protein
VLGRDRRLSNGRDRRGLQLGSEDGLDGTIGFDGKRSRGPPNRHDRNATVAVGMPTA